MDSMRWAIATQVNQMEKRFHWTIPLGPDEKEEIKLGYLVLPERHLSEAEWQHLMRCLELFKPGLVQKTELRGELGED